MWHILRILAHAPLAWTEIGKGFCLGSLELTLHHAHRSDAIPSGVVSSRLLKAWKGQNVPFSPLFLVPCLVGFLPGLYSPYKGWL